MNSDNLVTVVLVDGGTLNEVFLFNNVKSAERFYCKKVKELNPDANLEQELEDGNFSWNDCSVFISWPTIKFSKRRRR